MLTFRVARGVWLPIAAAACLALAILVVHAVYQATSPSPVDASGFSATRAHALVRDVVQTAPRPIGSAGNAAARSRLVASLRGLGFEPQVQTTFACGPYGTCAPVNNVLARSGTRGRGAVLLVAHYDSIDHGPGIADNGAGVAAALEIARVVSGEPARRRDVIWLFSDAEEYGLLGAQAFATQHPWAAEVQAVVNLDARGTSGPSLLVRTAGGAKIARAFGQQAGHPIASSVFPAVFEMMTYADTDFSVFQDRGVVGVDFAFIGGALRYHSSHDDLASLSLASLQHHGDNALAAVRALASSDDLAAGEDEPYFDVLGLTVVVLPVWLAWLLWAASAASMMGIVVSRRRRGELRVGQVAWGVAGWWLGILVAALASLGCVWLADRFGLPVMAWTSSPAPLLAAVWAVGVAGTWIAAAFTGRRAGPLGAFVGSWLTWLMFGATTLAWVPGVAYLFVLPPATAAIAAAIGELRRTREDVPAAAVIAPLVMAAIVVLPIASLLYEALGRDGLVVTAILVTVTASAAAPAWALASRNVAAMAALALFVCGCVGATWAGLAPGTGGDEKVYLAYVQDGDQGAASWHAYPQSGRLPASLATAAGFSGQPSKIFPWSGRGFAAAADTLALAAPRVEIRGRSTRGADRVVTLRLWSPRGADVVAVMLSPDAALRAVTVASQPMPRVLDKALTNRAGWSAFEVRRIPPEGVDVELVLGATDPIDAVIMDWSDGLPASGAALETARDGTGDPASGDATHVFIRHRL